MSRNLPFQIAQAAVVGALLSGMGVVVGDLAGVGGGSVWVLLIAAATGTGWYSLRMTLDRVDASRLDAENRRLDAENARTTAEERAADQIRTMEARLAASLAATFDPILHLDPTGAVQRFNAAATSMFGREMLTQGIPPSLSTVEGETVELIDTDGLPRRGVAREVPITEDGNEVGRVLAFRDRTEERALADELARANAELNVRFEELLTQQEELRQQWEEMASQQAELAERNADLISASRMKSEFLATMSHELRTPLNAVIGFAEVLLAPDAEGLSGAQIAHVRDILEAGQQLLVLLNDVLDLSRIEAGRLQIRVEDLDLLVPAHQAKEMIGQLARERRVQVETLLRPGECVVAADPDRVRQVLLNLMSNAVKFTPPGGRVTLDVEPGTASMIRARVIDTGIGIERRDLDKLFQPFTQIESGLARKHGGTGLGLAISRQLVEAMGGTIGCESTPGKGSTFWFTLPLADPRVATVPAVEMRPVTFTPVLTNGAAVAKGPGNIRLHLLIVDDNAANRRVIRSMLASLPYDLSEASDAPTAIKMARDLQPHVILMDLQMPGMDGLTATRLLSEDAVTARIPVLAVTAHAMLGDAERARDAGCVGYLSKPVGRDGLLSAIVAAAKLREQAPA